MGKQHRKLNLEERERIAILKASGLSLRKIASLMARSHSTLSRELKRNRFNSSKFQAYGPARAHVIAKNRKAKASRRLRLKDPFLRQYVADKLKLGWSPEQIAGRISRDRPSLHVSHEAIYQFIYYDAWHLFRFLARKHRRRRFKFKYSKPKGSAIPQRISIDQRPVQINQRLEFGHWESDSIVSRVNPASLHVLHERKSRLVRISKIIRNASPHVSRMIIRKLKTFSRNARRSITYDNGSENSQHLSVNHELKTISYFCHPYHSWEKGAVENSNGLIRRFIPKKSNIQRIPSSEITRIENLLNNRPRKCLNYQTPKEVFHALSGAIQG